METAPGIPTVFAVNVLAPYILTALIERPKRLVYLSSASRRASANGRSAVDQATLEWLVSLRGEQAVRCLAGICRRSPLERHQIQRAGAWMGSDKDGRRFSAGRSASRMRNPGVAC